MMLCWAYMDLVGIVRNVLDEFARLSKLVTNMTKSQTFLLGVDDELGASLQILLVFKLGCLSIMYLRVSLISIGLKHNDCMSLVERIFSMIMLWTSTSLTYVEHLQLIKFVLFFILVYWYFMFILPCSIILRIEGILVVFLYKDYSLFLF